MELKTFDFEYAVVSVNGFIFNQLNKLTMKFYSHLRYMNISFYLKSQLPICHRKFFTVKSRNREYLGNFSNDMEIPFHFACQKWFNQLN